MKTEPICKGRARGAAALQRSLVRGQSGRGMLGAEGSLPRATAADGRAASGTRHPARACRPLVTRGAPPFPSPPPPLQRHQPRQRTTVRTLTCTASPFSPASKMTMAKATVRQVDTSASTSRDLQAVGRPSHRCSQRCSVDRMIPRSCRELEGVRQAGAGLAHPPPAWSRQPCPAGGPGPCTRCGLRQARPGAVGQPACGASQVFSTSSSGCFPTMRCARTGLFGIFSNEDCRLRVQPDSTAATGRFVRDQGAWTPFGLESSSLIPFSVVEVMPGMAQEVMALRFGASLVQPWPTSSPGPAAVSAQRATARSPYSTTICKDEIMTRDQWRVSTSSLVLGERDWDPLRRAVSGGQRCRCWPGP